MHADRPDTVRGRVDRAATELSAPLLAGIALAAALGFVLFALQDPATHEVVHAFRHGAGITCH